MRGVRLPAVLPGFLVIAAGLVAAIFDGGFRETVWYPVALFLLALLVSTAVAAPPARRDRARLAEAALVAYALFAAWAFLSIIWAVTPGAAWDGANRILLYATVLGLVCLRPWSWLQASAALVLVALGTAALAIGVLVAGTTAGDPASFFIQGRLSVPTGYLNANANLWLIGFFPALHVAASRSLGWPLRGLGLAAATVLLQTALLSQSRGAALALVVAVVIYLVMTPRRWGALLAMAAVAGLTALAAGSLLDVRQAAEAAELGPALDDAAGAIAVSALVALVAGAAAALIGPDTRRLAEGPGARRIGNLTLAGAAVVAVVVALLSIGDPVDFADARWDDFRDSGYSEVESGRTRFGGSLGSGRYDFYRVALSEFADHPVLGIGADNFNAAYLQDRRTAESPQYPHSLVFMVLSQLGAVGAALLACFLALMVAAVVRGLRRGTREEGAVVAAAFAGAAVWLVHATGDWLWEFPALGILGLSLLGIAARTRTGARTAGDEPAARQAGAGRGESGGGARAMALRAAAAAIVLAASVSLAVPGVAARYASAAYDHAATDPSQTLRGLERAASLNRLDDEALLAKGAIAQRLGRTELAVDALRRATERAPERWYAHLELGLALAVDGRMEAALPSLREAVRLNPREQLARDALRSVRRGEAIDPDFVERRLRSDLESRVRPTDSSEEAAD